MAHTRTIYVRSGDTELWKRVAELAEQVGVPVAGVVARALRDYLPVLEAQAQQGRTDR